MIKAGTKNVPFLDGWRGTAIGLVLIGHFGGHHLGWLGTFGVHLFFGLSGLLMGDLLFMKRVELKEFFVRRFSRVVPTFLLYVFSIIVFMWLQQPSAHHVSFGEVLSTMTFLRTYLPANISILTRRWPIGHFWSLNVEEHSYAFLAAGAFICRRFRWMAAEIYFLFVSVSIIFILNFIYLEHPPAGASPWYLRSETASLGIVSAALLGTARNRLSYRWIKCVPSLFPILTLMVAALCVSTYSHKGVDKTIAPLLLAVSVVYLDCTPKLIRGALSLPLLRWFGKYSFSLYVWQQIFFLATLNHGMNRFFACALAIAVGSLSFYYFENPVRVAINRYWSARQKKNWLALEVGSNIPSQ